MHGGLCGHLVSMCLQGLTALMCATLAAHINVIKELLLAKADPMLKRKVSYSIVWMFCVYRITKLPTIIHTRYYTII